MDEERTGLWALPGSETGEKGGLWDICDSQQWEPHRLPGDLSLLRLQQTRDCHIAGDWVHCALWVTQLSCPGGALLQFSQSDSGLGIQCNDCASPLWAFHCIGRGRNWTFSVFHPQLPHINAQKLQEKPWVWSSLSIIALSIYIYFCCCCTVYKSWKKSQQVELRVCLCLYRSVIVHSSSAITEQSWHPFLPANQNLKNVL